MVHNGIEYGEMQLIAECYASLRYQNALSAEEIAKVFESWAADGYNSYLLEITIDILKEKNREGILVLDTILDKAGNKGTGAWTTIAASGLGVAIPTITAALFGRYQSFFKTERSAFSKSYHLESNQKSIDTDQLKHLYQISRIVNHHQGIQLIKAASKKHDWNINLDNLINVWTAGCIIRSALLLDILKGLDKDDFLHADHMVDYINNNIQAAKTAYGTLASGDLPYPATAASMEYFKTLIQTDGSANMIQAQRDYFGAHTYKLKSDPDGPSHHHIWIKD